MKIRWPATALSVDRMLWGAVALLTAVIVLSIVFSPPALPPLRQESEEALSFTAEETMRGRVVRVLSEEQIDVGGSNQYLQQTEVLITSGPLKGQTVVTEQGGMFVAARSSMLKPGMQVIVQHSSGPSGDRFYVSSIVRYPALIGLTVLFVAVILAVGRWTGLRSLLGLAFSVLVLAQFVLPRLLAGQSPVGVSIAGAIILMAPSLYLVYGWRGKTHAAVLGMSVSLMITWLLAALFVWWTHTTGFGDESVSFLVVASQVELDPRGLVLAGIILGTLGMLDDIAIGLASAVFELAEANPELPWTALFKHSMVIGVDHIASMVNSLLLAYVGASLPLFLLLILYQEPLGFSLNREVFVQEIVRTLVGGIGLVLTAPVTSLIACWMVKFAQPARVR